MSHPQLDCLPTSQAAQEIRQCKDILEQVLGQSVNSFAYPHGYHDREVRQMVVDSGYLVSQRRQRCAESRRRRPVRAGAGNGEVGFRRDQDRSACWPAKVSLAHRGARDGAPAAGVRCAAGSTGDGAREAA